MQKKPLYFLILLFAISIQALIAQEVKYDYAKEKKSVEQNSGEAQEKTESIQTKAIDTADSLSIKTLNKIDSLSNKTHALIINTTDSINNLSSHLQNKLQSNIDSLQQKLNQIQNKGGEVLSNTSGKAAHLTHRIDSLQNILSNKLQLDNLSKYANKIPGGDLADQLNTSNLPGLEKLSIPEIPNLYPDKLGIGSLSMPDNGFNSLTTQVNQQLGKITNLKDHDWINTDLPNYQQYTNEAKQYTEMIKDPSKIDQAVDAQAAQLSEFQMLNNETKELAAMKALPESMLADLKRYQDAQAMKAEAKEVAVKKATDYFANHQDKLTEAQNMMTELKKKYSYVPDSRDLSTAVKATSLKNEPIKKRLVFGLGFQLHQTDPISIDLAPSLMYKFNKNMAAGISGTYRASLELKTTAQLP